MAEVHDIVDENDSVIGTATQQELYSRKLTHRIVHVFVIHPLNRTVYFQKRAETKSYLPGFYCTSAGGHVRTGESYEKAAQRELSEELGLTAPLHKVHRTNFLLDGHNRFIELFLAFADSGITFNDGEVAGGEFITLEDAHKLILKGEKIHPQLEVCYKWLYANSDVIQKFCPTNSVA